MPRYMTNRQMIMRNARKRYSKNRNPYRPKKARAAITQGGVGGAVQRLTAGLPPPPEVKNRDTAVSLTYTSVGSWTAINTDAIYPITQGTGTSNRIGRKIRVLGVVLRINVNTTSVQPSTVDLVWDKSPNGALATVGQVYGGSSRLSLPNPDYADRFQFLKRIETNPSGNTSSVMKNVTVRMNHVVSFDANNGLIGDLESGNLILFGSFGGPVGTAVFEGTLRVLYVDA